jgi:nucleoside phosphorylase
MNILIVAPTEREFRNISAAIDAATLPRHRYIPVCSGIGKAASAAAVTYAIATSEAPIDAVAVIGFAAGTLGYRQGEIVCPSVAQYHDCNVPEGFIPELTDPIALSGGSEGVMVLTGDSFVNADIVGEIKEQFGVEHAIFDMEITSIAIAVRLCFNLPVYAMKMISDVPEAGHTEQSYDEFADSHSDFSPFIEILNQIA